MSNHLQNMTQLEGHTTLPNLISTTSKDRDEVRMALLHQLTGVELNSLALLNAQQHQHQQQQEQAKLSFTAQNSSSLSILGSLQCQPNLAEIRNKPITEIDSKRKPEDRAVEDINNKRPRTSNDEEANSAVALLSQEGNGPEPVAASEEGISCFKDSDVLSGRGGGTNVHPGNRQFRDLINLHRRAYLKARKNDKPMISRAIVRVIRENNGAFLKRDEKTGLWYEIGDDAAREKTSQALRQRAPEMRKILFESEREQARHQTEIQLRQQQQQQQQQQLQQQQQQLLAAGIGSNPNELNILGSNFNFQGLHQGMAMNTILGTQTPHQLLNPLIAMQMNKQALGGHVSNLSNDPYSPYHQNLMTAALLGGGISRFTPNGA
jgi:hypothetical protein